MILAIDTATDWIGLAIHDGASFIAEAGWRNRRTQTIELAPAIAQLWARAGINPADLEAIAVAVGPGSYTGLRVGLSVAKGIALGHKLPLVGVGTLDIVAAGTGRMDEDLVVVVEAGRSRLWAGTYRWTEKRGWLAAGEPHQTTWETLIEGIDRPTVFTGEVAHEAAKLIRRSGKGAKIASPAAAERRAAVLAEIGFQRWKSRDVVDAKQLTPLYLREPG
jgi:tRNA threonylcarbamoyladenosine biosynthesis protein TsaB